MKLIATMMMSVDGVYQGPGGPDEDRDDGFEHNLELVETISTPSGVTVQTYRPAGRATFRNADE